MVETVPKFLKGNLSFVWSRSMPVNSTGLSLLKYLVQNFPVLSFSPELGVEPMALSK